MMPVSRMSNDVEGQIEFDVAASVNTEPRATFRRLPGRLQASNHDKVREDFKWTGSYN
jgi:hypothetical protein